VGIEILPLGRWENKYRPREKGRAKRVRGFRNFGKAQGKESIKSYNYLKKEKKWAYFARGFEFQEG
jgi:hypothetical protein